jgi:uncharacterized protein
MSPTRSYPAATADAPVLVLGHGAGAGQDHPWMRRVAQGLASRGVFVVTFNFPYMDAKKSVPDKAPVLEEAFAKVWRDVAISAQGPMFAGGKSMGGRIASQVASKGGFDPPSYGFVFFGYPLHPPGKPAQRRDQHLPSIAAPMLFLQGTRDPFGAPEEMTPLVDTLNGASLEILDGGDHSLVASKAQEAKSSRLERAIDLAATWILSRAS